MTRDGDWAAETARGQFLQGDSTKWLVRLYSGIEVEYDLTEWAPYDPKC
ncbi:hypothetical protein [Leifsonia sp. NPDC077715]